MNLLSCLFIWRLHITMKKYFQTITLFTILAFLLLTTLIIVAISHQPEELKSDILLNLAIAILVIAAVDVLLKLILKLKKSWLWALQIFLLLVTIYIWIISE